MKNEKRRDYMTELELSALYNKIYNAVYAQCMAQDGYYTEAEAVYTAHDKASGAVFFATMSSDFPDTIAQLRAFLETDI
jgi:hypothetical protein